MKLNLLLVLVCLTSLQVGAQSLDRNGQVLPAITPGVPTTLDGKANLVSPTFRGWSRSPKTGVRTNSNQLATIENIVRVDALNPFTTIANVTSNSNGSAVKDDFIFGRIFLDGIAITADD